MALTAEERTELDELVNRVKEGAMEAFKPLLDLSLQLQSTFAKIDIVSDDESLPDEILQIIPAPGWHVNTKSTGRSQPLIGWALIKDSQGNTFVRGISASGTEPDLVSIVFEDGDFLGYVLIKETAK